MLIKKSCFPGGILGNIINHVGIYYFTKCLPMFTNGINQYLAIKFKAMLSCEIVIMYV